MTEPHKIWIEQCEAARGYADENVTLEAVQDWAMASTRLILFPENGLGPGGDDNLGFCSINWSMLEEFPSE